MHFEQSKIICPGCDHEFDDNDMSNVNSEGHVDLWDLPPSEDRAFINCPACKVEFWVAGTYRPLYTTSINEDDL